jgi:hypothetical protein
VLLDRDPVEAARAKEAAKDYNSRAPCGTGTSHFGRVAPAQGDSPSDPLCERKIVYNDHSESRRPCASTRRNSRADPFRCWREASVVPERLWTGAFDPLGRVVAEVAAEIGLSRPAGSERIPPTAAEVAAVLRRAPIHFFVERGIPTKPTAARLARAMVHLGRGRGPDWGVRWAALCWLLDGRPGPAPGQRRSGHDPRNDIP